MDTRSASVRPRSNEFNVNPIIEDVPRVLLLAGACAASALDWREGRPFGISKRGNRYLRKLLVRGARSAVLRVKQERSPFGPWLDTLETRAPINVVVTAAANKLTRIAWGVLSSGQDYRAPGNTVAA